MGTLEIGLGKGRHVTALVLRRRNTVQVQDPLIHNRNISIFKRGMLHIL